MRQSQLFTKTFKTTPKEDPSINAQLLIKGGFIDKLMAGVYTYLPLGYRVLDKIKNIIRREMNALGGQEIFMPALTPKEIWQQTDRWDSFDALWRFKGSGDKDYALGATHEEIVTPLLKKFISSYKDLPTAVYQIQDKFRNEARAKSGLLRGREFSMKDLYSFHATEKDLDEYYEKVKASYLKIFSHCGLEALVVEASGGAFSKYSHEFQVLTPEGEDEIYFCPECGRHQNKELVQDNKCPHCAAVRQKKKAIEVGNIFKLKTRFSKSFNLTYTDQQGQSQLVMMGCYGLGPSRIMGTIAEIHHDSSGIIWPATVAPYLVHLLNLSKNSAQADKFYATLQKQGIEVLYDDRDQSAGSKFNDADLLGLPVRLVISEKTKDQIEYKLRCQKQAEIITSAEVINRLKKL